MSDVSNVVDGTDADAASAVLGVAGSAGQVPDEQESTEETAFDQLPESWQKEIQRLRRQAAAKRVEKKVETKAEVTPKDVDLAREDAKREARQEFGEKLAAARIEAALAGLVPNPEEVVEDLNLARYVDENGDVDTDAVSILKNRYAAIAGRKGARVGHGRSGGASTQTSTADLFAEAMKDFL